MGITSEEELIQELQQVSFQPVFILGLHRSGTSILYKMLVATGTVNPVTAYHVIMYNELLVNHHQGTEDQVKQHLTQLFVEKGQQDRGIDRLKLTADFAEEYGFLLNRKTLRMSLGRKNVALFTEMCKKIQRIAGNDRPILLKNPYDFSNFLCIKQMFPHARFIFIHRHPLKTISSTLNAVKMLLQQKNPYTTLLSHSYDMLYSNPLIRYPLRFIFCTIPECGVVLLTGITTMATSYYMRNIDKLPQEDYVSISYEELCLHPTETLETIMKKLSLPPGVNIDTSTLMKPRATEVNSSVKKFQKQMYRLMKQYWERFHYTIDE